MDSTGKTQNIYKKERNTYYLTTTMQVNLEREVGRYEAVA